MIIEKKTVIKALKTEPLQYGTFFDTAVLSERNCSVCAVGAVIRKSLGRKINKSLDICSKFGIDLSWYCQELTQNKYVGYTPEGLLKNKNYLGALSCYFESFFSKDYDRNVTLEIREKLIEFAKKNFPTRFKVRDFEELAKESLEDVREQGN